MEFKIMFFDDFFHVSLKGKASVKDCADYLDHLIAHDKWEPGSSVFSDETGLEVSHLTSEDIKAIASVCSSRKDVIGASRFAAYVESAFVYGMNRMWQGYVAQYWDAKVDVFKARAEALAWLQSA